MKQALFDHYKVNMAFQGKLSVEKLPLEEQQVHTQILWQSLENLDGSDDSLLQEIQKNGGTVYGIDKQGTIRESDSRCSIPDLFVWAKNCEPHHLALS